MIRIAVLLASSLAAATLAPAAPPALRPPPPQAAALLGRAMAPAELSYYGKMLEVQWYGKQARANEIQIFYKPGMLRREIHAHGSSKAQLAISDGDVEWIVLPSQKRAYKGVPSKTLPKQLGPEAEQALLLKNYTVKVHGPETVAERKAWVVDIDPVAKGKPRQTLWIDEQTGLILRSKRFRANGSLAALSQFVHIRIPAEVPDELVDYEPPKGYKVEDHGLSPQFLSLDGLKDAVASPPAVPQTLPGGFQFESAGTVSTHGQSVVHLRYTDGLLNISLFQSPVPVRLRELADSPGEGRLPGGRILQWKADKRSYILIGDLSQGMMRRLAAEFKDLKKSDGSGKRRTEK